MRPVRNADADAMGIYEDVIELHGFDGAYHSFNSFCERLQHKEPEQSDRLSFFPCAEMQVDYDEDALGMVFKTRLVPADSGRRATT